MMCVAFVVLFPTTALAAITTFGDVEPELFDPNTGDILWDSSTTAYIGNEYNGALTIDDGSYLFTGAAYIGCLPGSYESMGVVTVDGATWTNSGDLWVGWGYEGGNLSRLSITNGGVVATGSLFVDRGTLSITNGSVLATSNGAWVGVNGGRVDGSTWNSGGDLSFDGPFNITNGSIVTCIGGSNPGDFNTIGGTMTVDRSTWNNNNDLYVGDQDICGTLSIINGGTVSNNNGWIGWFYDSHGSSVTVNGTGSTWINYGGLIVARGTLLISNGGTVLSKGGEIDGNMTVDGAGSTWTNNGDLYVGYSDYYSDFGILSISNGSTVSNNNGWIGYAGAEVTVDGTHSTWTNNGDLYVGYSSYGELSITNGGAVGNNNGWIGYNNMGSVKVDGTGSTWTNNGDLCVGYSNYGTLSITKGGAVSNNNGCIGYASGCWGSVTVDGAGSTWTNKDDLIIGNSGAGTLSITGGAAVGNNNGWIGHASGSTGSVTVDGAGSTWTNKDDLIIGNSGAGTLSITGGGAVGNNNGWIGYASGSTGVVTVSGAGSTWNNSGDLYVGYSGGGTLSITKGGTVTAGSVSINSQSVLEIDVGHGSSLSVGGGGINNAGTIRILAGARVPIGNTYSPISAGIWSGTYEAVGGTWDTINHRFTASNVQEGTAGIMVSIDPATTQRMHISDSGTHQSVGLSFLSASLSKQINVVAAPMSGTPVYTLQNLLEPGQSVLSAWNFSVTGNGYTTGNTAFLSLQAANEDAIKRYYQVYELWEYNMNNPLNPWSMIEPPEYPSLNFGLFGPNFDCDFSVFHFSGYAITGVPVPAPGTVYIDWKGGTISDPTNWNVAANWNPDTAVPNGPGTNVSFGNQPAANNVVDMISQAQTVGTITFFANTSTTIQSSGGFALTLDNSGSGSTIYVAGTHTISAQVILNNDALIVGTGTLNLSGGITGSHDLEVDINLTATSIQVDTLTIDSGATVTIQAIPGGPQALCDNLKAVPEPSAFVLLGVCTISLLAYGWRRRIAK